MFNFVEQRSRRKRFQLLLRLIKRHVSRLENALFFLTLLIIFQKFLPIFLNLYSFFVALFLLPDPFQTFHFSFLHFSRILVVMRQDSIFLWNFEFSVLINNNFLLPSSFAAIFPFSFGPSCQRKHILQLHRISYFGINLKKLVFFFLDDLFLY